MKKRKNELGRKRQECKNCEGCGLVQSKDGSITIDCTTSKGSGFYNPYE